MALTLLSGAAQREGNIDRSSTARRSGRAALDAWRSDRPVAVLVGSLSLVYGFAWRWTTRPMGDSESYRQVGRDLRDGWHQVGDRTAGYPLLLWLTGSLDHETHALFVVQLLMHAVSVVLVVRVMVRLGAPPAARLVAAALLFAPPVMLGVVYAGSEALTELLVVVMFWAFVRWHLGGRVGWLVAASVSLGLATWVRPSYVALVVPIAAVVLIVQRAAVRSWRPVVMAAFPALALAGVLLIVNVVRFDHVGFTPLTGWYLGSRTSTFVDELPDSYEPARSILVAERDRQLLRTDEFDAPNYSFFVRDELQDALGLDRRELDDYMLDLNVHLIAGHPFEYVYAVIDSSPRFADIDSRPAVAGLGRAVARLLTVVHWLLAAAVLLVAVLVPGLVLAGRVGRKVAGTLAFVGAVAGTVFVTSVATETGTARLRTPLDALLVVAFVLGAGIVARAVTERRARPARP